MKTETFTATAESAYGKKLDTPIKYEGTYDAYTDYSEVVAANDLPNNDEVLSFRNAQRKANARQKSLQAALDAAGIVKPTIENDTQLRLRKMYDLFVANGSTESEAKEKAALALGLTWSE